MNPTHIYEMPDAPKILHWFWLMYFMAGDY